MTESLVPQITESLVPQITESLVPQITEWVAPETIEVSLFCVDSWRFVDAAIASGIADRAAMKIEVGFVLPSPTRLAAAATFKLPAPVRTTPALGMNVLVSSSAALTPSG